MLTIDLTSNSGGTPRWNINNFISTSRKRDIYIGSKDIPKEDVVELDKVLRTIDVEYNRVSSELDRQFKDLSSMESQLKKRIDSFNKMGEPGEIEIQYRKMALDIISARTKISMEKAKLYESKIKQIREERKLLFEKNKNNIAIPGTDNNPNSTSPVAIANSIENKGLNGMGVKLPSHIISGLATRVNNTQPISTNNIVETPKEVQLFKEPVKEGETTSTFQVENSTPSNNIEESMVKKEYLNNSERVINPNSLNLKTSDTVTIGDKYVENMNLIKAREKNKDLLLKKQEGFLGAKMSTSLSSLVSHTEDIQEVLFVDKHTGRYWLKGFTKNENGQEVESLNYQPKSILHIGNIRFDVKNQLVKTTHYDNSIPYRLSDESEMSDFYNKEWNKDSSNRFVLEDSVLELI